MNLPRAFYERPVLEVANDLVGCVVSHRECAGVIVETEAYHDSEPACHAFVGLTSRTRTLFGRAGLAYVYRSYGIHALLNAVCEPEGVGAAVLIRALQPLAGIEQMRARRSDGQIEQVRVRRSDGQIEQVRARRSAGQIEGLCSGPGKLTQALAIDLRHNDGDLAHGPVVISARPQEWRAVPVTVGKRIGITKAMELPWRFCADSSRFLSRPLRP
ncbi:MAG: DNA-3-methyladenine glycosylase [Solirubrobacteraceae bacterium]